MHLSGLPVAILVLVLFVYQDFLKSFSPNAVLCFAQQTPANLDPTEEEGTVSLLLEAVSSHNIGEIRNAVEVHGEHIDTVNTNGWSAVMFAVSLMNMDSLRVLIELGADLNNPDKHGITPLMLAADANDKDIVELLLAGNANPLQVSNDGRTAFDISVRAGRQVVSLLIAEACALHAIKQENPDLLLQAVRDGAYVNIRNPTGWTPLMFFAVRGNVHAVNTLLREYNADPNRTEEDGWTALHFAAVTGHEQVIKMLLNNGADPSIVTIPNQNEGGTGLTARQLAQREGFKHIVSLIPYSSSHEL